MRIVNSVYEVMVLALVASCCPLAFDWKQKPPEIRASLSPIVAVGYVIKSYRDSANTSTTKYAVDFKIVRTLKGEEFLKKITPIGDIDSKVYRITNFGSKLMCLADLDLRSIYMLFLQVINDGISAYYTDLFGAAEYWSMEMEETVIKANFGYQAWSEWSACSESCGEKGHQIRRRICSREFHADCIGNNTELRHCNTFQCQGVKDLLELVDLKSMTRGVISVNIAGKDIYDITPNFNGKIPLKDVFPSSIPNEFSIMARVRPRKTKYPREGQYLFSVADANRQYLGLKVYPTPTLEILHVDNETCRVSIPLSQENVNDGHWHQFAFSVKGQKVTMYYNCFETTSKVIPWNLAVLDVDTSELTLASLNNTSDRGADDRYEGLVSQLVITDNPNDAQYQCLPDTWTALKHHKIPSSTKEKSNDADPPNYNYQEHWEWSSWSACSVSCGLGVQERTPFCRDSRINPDDCVPYYVPQTYEKKCYAGPCPDKNKEGEDHNVISAKCEASCANGGTCTDNKCICPSGWRGSKCKRKASVCEQGCLDVRKLQKTRSRNVSGCKEGMNGNKCEVDVCQKCKNGGSCHQGRNKCSCPKGYIGKRCQHKVNPLLCIRNPCKNRGRCIGINKCYCKSRFSGQFCELEKHKQSSKKKMKKESLKET